MRLEIIHREPASRTHAAPLLFLHGLWHGAWCWDEHCLSYFAARGYDVSAMSLRGHGQSEGKEKLCSARLRDYLDDLGQVAGQFKTPPILIGHSMGGLLVQKYLETHAAPAAVLVASAPPFGIFHSMWDLLHRHPLAMFKCMFTLSTRSFIATPALYRELFFLPTFPEERLAEYFARLSDASLASVLDMVAFDLPHPNRIHTPLLVLGAERDGSIHPPHFAATAKIYHADFYSYPLSHAMMLDDGWQAVADDILTWLNQRDL